MFPWARFPHQTILVTVAFYYQFIQAHINILINVNQHLKWCEKFLVDRLDLGYNDCTHCLALCCVVLHLRYIDVQGSTEGQCGDGVTGEVKVAGGD